MKLEYFDKLEAESREILRRSSPCPKQYKTYEYNKIILHFDRVSCITLCPLTRIEEFDTAVESVKLKFHPDSVEWRTCLLMDFDRQWSKLREKLCFRIGRKTI